MKARPPSVAQRVNALGREDQLSMSFVTCAGLPKGAQRSRRQAEVLRQLASLARQVPVCYLSDTEICRHYAEQFTRLKAAGMPIGANDLWIAAHALAEKAVLVTNNGREFERISGLALENWASA